MSIARRCSAWIAALTLGVGLSSGVLAPAQAAPSNAEKTPQAPKHSSSVTDILKNLGTNIAFPTVQPWKLGQSATHKLTVDLGTSGDVTANLRLAITPPVPGDKEPVPAGYYWVECNLTNVGGRAGQQFAPMFSGLHLRFLTKQTNEAGLKSMLTDVAKSPTSPAAAADLIKKFQFQLNDGPLYQVDLSELESTVGSMVPPELSHPDTSTGTPGVPEGDFSFKTGRENVTVPGGTFNNSLFWDATYSNSQGSGNLKVDLHQDVPLIPVARLLLNASGQELEGGNMQVKLELSSSLQTGATTLTKGAPVKKSLTEIMNEVMGNLMAGTTSASNASSSGGN